VAETPAEPEDAVDGGGAVARRPQPIGPTGKPLQPVGALFEAAFRRLGGGLSGYLLYTVCFGLLPLSAALLLDAQDAGGSGALLVFVFAFALGHFLLVGTFGALIAETLRSRAAVVLAAATFSAALSAVLAVTLTPPAALLLYPVLGLAPVAAASGDAGAVGAFAVAARLVRRWFTRCYLVVLGLGVCFAALWFGTVVSLSPLEDATQQRVAFLLSCLILWPLAALVMRNLYGDLTGRLVIRDASPPRRRRSVRFCVL
jgi:hypothetical protein